MKLREEFHQHIADETVRQERLDELYEAIFRKEDKDGGVPPGLMQMMVRINGQMEDMAKWNDRQKTFMGGVVFTISSIWFFVSDLGPRILVGLKKLMGVI